MLKRFPILLSMLVLAACSGSHQDENTASAPAQTAPATAQTVAASGAATPMSAASSEAPTATGTAATTPAASTSPAGAASTGNATAQAPAAAGTAAAAAAFVDDGKWVEGKQYFRIEPSQPKVTDSGKIELVEVFSYGCPACFHAHAFVDKMEASLPAGAQMVYLPASFRPDENWPLYQQAYYAAQALGIAHKAHDAMFEATWKTGETATYDLSAGRPKAKDNWPTLQDIAKFYAKYGVSADDFVATAHSFSVKTKMKRADELVKAYGAGSTPNFVVDGKYRFDPASAGGYAQAIELAQWLVAKEAAGK